MTLKHYINPVKLAKILVVDDTPINMDLLTHAVEDMGHEVIEAVNGAAALAVVDKQTPDLVLLDYLLPDIQGIDVLKAIRNKYSAIELPVIIVTSFYEATKVIEAIQHGANDYIHKPFDFEVLQARIESNLLLKFNEKKLQLAKDEAESANEAKTDFLSMISHELRTPLTAIVGFCQILRHEVEKNNHQQYLENLDHILSSSNRMLSLTDDLLDIAKIESHKIELSFEETPVLDVINGCILDLKPVIQQNNNKLDVIINDDDTIYTDINRCVQILTNILGNAAKFTNNGTISIRTKKVEYGNRKFLNIMIQDTGIGIAEENLNNLFRKFSQVHDKTNKNIKGTGLGLMISKQLCEKLGGDITVISKQGEGSTFTISLPDYRDGSTQPDQNITQTASA